MRIHTPISFSVSLDVPLRDIPSKFYQPYRHWPFAGGGITFQVISTLLPGSSFSAIPKKKVPVVAAKFLNFWAVTTKLKAEGGIGVIM